MRFVFLLLFLATIFTIIPGGKSNFFDFIKKLGISLAGNSISKVEEIKGTKLSSDAIQFFVFSNTLGTIEYVHLNPYRPKPLMSAGGPIVFLIHGWLECREVLWYKRLTEALLKLENSTTVVQVDWSQPARHKYGLSAYYTEEVGKYIAELIIKVVTDYDIPLKNFVVIGHSLGGQVAGFVGKSIKQIFHTNLHRIIALDPAGPVFIDRKPSKRLNKHDADVVHVVHTDIGCFGFGPRCGTIDFYVNGGKDQPGCDSVDLDDSKSYVDPIMCDHARSHDTFIEAIKDPEQSFSSKKCSDYKSFLRGFGCQSGSIHMGDLTIEKQTGTYYLQTNKESPFSKKPKRFSFFEDDSGED